MTKTRFTIVVVAAAALAAFLIGMAMTADSGTGFTADSVFYVSTAESLRQGRGLVDQSSNPLLLWPPGYPALLASLDYLGVGLNAGTRLVNAMAFALLAGVTSAWFVRRLKSEWLALAGILTILLSVAILRVVEFAWTETLFAALVVVGVVFVDAFVSKPRRRTLVIAAAAVALATFVRYAGISIVAAGALAIWTRHSSPRRIKLRDVSIFCAIGGGPIALWYIRNVVLYSSFTGGRIASQSPVLEQLIRFFRAVGAWFVPSRLPAVLLIVVVVFVLLWLALNVRSLPRISNPAVVPLIFALTYFAFVLLVALVTQIDPLDNRLLSPGFAPLAMSLFAATDALRSGAVIRRSLRRPAAVGLLLVFLLLGRSTIFGVRYIPEAAASPALHGYNRVLNNSPLIRWVSDYEPPWNLYSNDPPRIYATAHLRSKFAPLKDSPESLRRLEAIVAEQDVMLVWFKKSFRPSVTLDVLKKDFDLRTLTTQKDGAAYLVRPLKKPK